MTLKTAPALVASRVTNTVAADADSTWFGMIVPGVERQREDDDRQVGDEDQRDAPQRQPGEAGLPVVGFVEYPVIHREDDTERRQRLHDAHPHRQPPHLVGDERSREEEPADDPLGGLGGRESAVTTDRDSAGPHAPPRMASQTGRTSVTPRMTATHPRHQTRSVWLAARTGGSGNARKRRGVLAYNFYKWVYV